MTVAQTERALEGRYSSVSDQKFDGATYTPKLLADFVAKNIVEESDQPSPQKTLRILDPAVGDGELLVSMLEALASKFSGPIEVYGFEKDPDALRIAKSRLLKGFPGIALELELADFLERFATHRNNDLFEDHDQLKFDLIIANPPYVRTQILGANLSKLISEKFDLNGRVDLYHAFILGMSEVLQPWGTAGIIVSNRFMTTQAGASVRKAILTKFSTRHVWDLGDTKIFDAAVLPAVLLVKGVNGESVAEPTFSAIYETKDEALEQANDPIDALSKDGVVQLADGRRFLVQHGSLDTGGVSDGVWRLATAETDQWLATVQENTWGTFRDIGKIRVGVKTTADKVFIRDDWNDLFDDQVPELLRPLTTHHSAGRFKAKKPKREKRILYTHEVVEGKRRSIEISNFPVSMSYLESHRERLEGRKYVIEAGRNWYEIWVPQDPSAWEHLKLVFRDISAEPVFWLDKSGSVVNGDCYWMINEGSGSDDLLWLAAAVGNSTFIESFYDHRFRNKLYAGRRRFITQYVEKFPLPDPALPSSKAIINMAKKIYSLEGDAAIETQKELDALVWEAFGLGVKEVSR